MMGGQKMPRYQTQSVLGVWKEGKSNTLYTQIVLEGQSNMLSHLEYDRRARVEIC